MTIIILTSILSIVPMICLFAGLGYALSREEFVVAWETPLYCPERPTQLWLDVDLTSALSEPLQLAPGLIMDVSDAVVAAADMRDGRSENTIIEEALASTVVLVSDPSPTEWDDMVAWLSNSFIEPIELLSSGSDEATFFSSTVEDVDSAPLEENEFSLLPTMLEEDWNQDSM